MTDLNVLALNAATWHQKSWNMNHMDFCACQPQFLLISIALKIKENSLFFMHPRFRFRIAVNLRKKYIARTV